MLVMTRRPEEGITITIQGTPMFVRVLKIQKRNGGIGNVSIGIEAPKEWGIARSELPPLADAV